MNVRCLSSRSTKVVLLLGGLAQAFSDPVQAQVARGVDEGLESPSDLETVRFEGRVLLPDGGPAAGFAVETSAGGRALTDSEGHFRIDTPVSPRAERVEILVPGAASAGLTASTCVAPFTSSGTVWVGALRLAPSLGCVPSWQPTFQGIPGVDGDVRAVAVFDDGQGPAVYAAGRFSVAGRILANNIAKWDGSSWSALGDGTNDDIEALVVFDDGTGSALYAGGHFTTAGGVSASRVARWDGTSWTPLGAGIGIPGFLQPVYSLCTYDDGSGQALYVGGDFTRAGGAPARNIAKWDGSSWWPLAGGVEGRVNAMAVYDDGTGPALHVAGEFLFADGLGVRRIAKWDGSAWSSLQTTNPCPPNGCGTNSTIFTLAVFDDGGGPDLYAGGSFPSAGGTVVNYVGRWDGTDWTALGNGLAQTVDVLQVFDDGSGSGPALYAASGDTLMSWDGSQWTMLLTDIPIQAMAEYEGVDGKELILGSFFQAVGTVVLSGIARWTGSDLTPLGSGNGLGGRVYALTEFDDGNGPALYAAGEFETAGNAVASHIARWDGSSWSALGTVLGDILALAVHDDGTGPALYAGGALQVADGMAVGRIAKWDGSDWSALGTGLNGDVEALAEYDDGTGSALYAGGSFTTAGGASANRIAKWDGSAWSTLGSGMNSGVLALVTHDDGGGPALFAGGGFTTAGGVSANFVAKWDGTSWSALGGGTSLIVRSLVVFDDGSGPALYAGLRPPTSGGGTDGVMKWDGSTWSAVGSGIDTVYTLAVHDDGTGPRLVAGGTFTTAGGAAANHVARWDGSAWNPLGGGLDRVVFALRSFDGFGGPALYAGGGYYALEGKGSHLAQWGCDITPPHLTCPSAVYAVEPLGGPPGRVVSFSVSAEDEVDPAPSVACSPPSGSFFSRGTTMVTCTATDASGNQSVCQFPVTVEPRTRHLPLSTPLPAATGTIPR